MTSDQAPIYNLKAALVQTGLKADTLRAWERRYGLPQPERTDGGHRLYSQRDIDIVNWLQDRQSEGLSISNAVDLWNRLEESGQDPLHIPEYSQPQPAVGMEEVAAGNALEELRQAWVKACQELDERRAEEILTRAFALYPTELVCYQVILEGLSLIGDGWFDGSIAVEQEHFASELATRRLEALVAAAPAPFRRGQIVMAAAPGEAHALAPLLLTLILRRQGWDVVHLGGNVPLPSFESVVESVHPQLIIVTAQQLHTAANLLEVARYLLEKNVPMAYGGRIFIERASIRRRIPGFFLGENLESAPENVQQIMADGHIEGGYEPADPAYEGALAQYRDRLPRIELNVWRKVGDQIPREDLSRANDNLARDIQAALILGDIHLVDHEISWTRDLMSNRQMSAELMKRFMDAYSQAAGAELERESQLILDWLAEMGRSG